MACNKHHKFQIVLYCLNCLRKQEIIRYKPCNALNGQIENKRVGCMLCNTSLLMWFFCAPGRIDKEEMFPLKITITNLD